MEVEVAKRIKTAGILVQTLIIPRKQEENAKAEFVCALKDLHALIAQRKAIQRML